MGQEDFSEKRRAPRFKAEGAVKLVLEDGTTLAGLLKDVSRIGAFVAVQHAAEEWVYQSCAIEITASAAEETVFISGECVVVRATAKGIGIYINAIDEMSRIGFVRFMSQIQRPENAI
ncbi:MAG: PilZ domain-containing protein [Pseudomonadales bacterium]|nr:PilZ domain-containing protein [Pseudomonadales bacterium]